ncbi:ORF6N domain-containing protein [Belliella sp. DSM 107340]|uniref:ORF6N domain-containing protein n=1 Tax=Belliella calami TaxID=2923436 RepID=A0ABS9UP42_9BACT|nr:ORF6N domain-containing protein [Belliella calami]MCH7397930.1 ORF6N domain-containing protein [Belliella calami]
MNREIILSQQHIENKIYNVRGVQVMLDSDLAAMYEVSTGRLNEQVKRNIERFPDDFMFQLTQEEWEILMLQEAKSSLRSQNAILENKQGKHRKYLPYVFTEQGVSGLSGILKSQAAANMHVAIMRAFVQMRKFINDNLGLLQRMDGIERRQLETDQKFEKVFKALERKDIIPSQGIFFDGQVFDAYGLASKIIRSAKKNIVLIDNYIDETTLTHLAKKTKAVNVLLLTKTISKQLALDVKKANEQYSNFELKTFTQSHDRFLIIDGEEVYHLGASLKDLGKKWFAFSKMDKTLVNSILKEVDL